jgi:hypothetical protein
MIGNRYGRLLVLEHVPNPKGHGAKWRCQCSCGNIIETRGSNLRDGQTTSCGCYQIEATIARSRTHGKSDSREYRLWSCAKHRASRLGIPFNIEYTDIVIPEFCPVLGIRLESTKRRSSGPQPQSPTLDKINPVLGYIKGNTWVISARANSLKNDATLEELQKLAFAVSSVSPMTCSECGSLSGPTGWIGLSVRNWVCRECGTPHDRDVNAAINTLKTGAGYAHESYAYA